MIKEKAAPTKLVSEEVMNHYLDWLNEGIKYEEYEGYEFFGPYVLVRLYYFSPDTRGKVNILDTTGASLSQESRSRILPIAKIIKVGAGVSEAYEALNPGDLVTVPDDITGSVLNPDWTMFQQVKDERPAPKTPEPPKYLGKISMWAKYVFVGNKLKENIGADDAFTFLVPQTFIQAKLLKDVV